MKQLNIRVNLYLEFINSILLTSNYNAITKPHVGYGLMTEEVNEYTTAIKSFFENYKQHKIYALIENMIPSGFTFSRPVELALALGDSSDFSIQHPISELCIAYCGGMNKINELLGLEMELARESNYFDFFSNIVQDFYRPILEKMNKELVKLPYISLIESQYGKEQNSYNFIVSSLMKGNYGIHFPNKDNHKTDIFAVFSTDDISLSPVIILHEYSHPFINPITEKHIELVQEYKEAYEWLKPYKLPHYKSGYGDWTECVNEHLIRAMVIHFLRKSNCTDLASEVLKNEENFGYKYVPLLLEKYEYYDKNRSLYPTFESFYPEVLRVFAQKI